MSRLIIVDGLSTVGKSTFSKRLSHEIGKTTRSIWIHEESLNHPIRDHEFEAGALDTAEGMEKNAQEMLSRWSNFAKTLEQEDAIFVIEGCYLHSLDRYLLQCAWTNEQILEFLRQIAIRLSHLHPLLVLLYREDIFSSYDIEFKKRGQWWEELIKAPREITGHAKNLLTGNEDSIYLRTPKYQKYMLDLLPLLPMDSMAIETMEGKWDDYLALVMNKLNIEIIQDGNVETFLPERFVGTYSNEVFSNPIIISYDKERNITYMTLFWPFMELRYLGSDCFELISFPATLCFSFDQGTPSFTISGNYDWEADLEGKRFERISI